MGVASASSRVRLTSDLLGSGTSTPSSFVRLSYARREASSRMQMLTRVHTAGESSAGHEDRGAARRGGRLRSERERERDKYRHRTEGESRVQLSYACVGDPFPPPPSPLLHRQLHHLLPSSSTYSRGPSLHTSSSSSPLAPLYYSSVLLPPIFFAEKHFGSTSSGCVIENQNFSLHEEDHLLDLLFPRAGFREFFS